VPPAELELGVARYLLQLANKNSTAAIENFRQLQGMVHAAPFHSLSPDARKQLEALEVEQVAILNKEHDNIQRAVDAIFAHLGDYSITKEEAEKKVKDIIWKDVSPPSGSQSRSPDGESRVPTASGPSPYGIVPSPGGIRWLVETGDGKGWTFLRKETVDMLEAVFARGPPYVTVQVSKFSAGKKAMHRYLNLAEMTQTNSDSAAKRALLRVQLLEPNPPRAGKGTGATKAELREAYGSCSSCSSGSSAAFVTLSEPPPAMGPPSVPPPPLPPMQDDDAWGRRVVVATLCE